MNKNDNKKYQKQKELEEIQKEEQKREDYWIKFNEEIAKAKIEKAEEKEREKKLGKIKTEKEKSEEREREKEENKKDMYTKFNEKLATIQEAESEKERENYWIKFNEEIAKKKAREKVEEQERKKQNKYAPFKSKYGQREEKEKEANKHRNKTWNEILEEREQEINEEKQEKLEIARKNPYKKERCKELFDEYINNDKESKKIGNQIVEIKSKFKILFENPNENQYNSNFRYLNETLTYLQDLYSNYIYKKINIEKEAQNLKCDNIDDFFIWEINEDVKKEIR